MQELESTRENWGSRGGFVLAAIGSAVGLGNVWRFPHECYSNGGSAFLIPYIVAMAVIGVPLLIMEFSLGHLTQLAAPEAFRRVGRRWEFVGWWPIILSFIIVTYYGVVLAWCLNYLVASFSSPLPWAQDAEGFFYNEYLGFTGSFALGGVRWPILAALAVVWVVMYLCIFKGVRIVSKIVFWTVPIPWVMLLILMVRGLTLEGAVQGLEYFLEPDWSRLGDPAVWRAAFGQVFFSLTIAFGVMITYASFLHRRSDLNNNAAIVALADLGTSLIAGLAVFSTMGALAVSRQLPVHEVLSETESVGLAFVAFPKALAALPWWPNFFSVIFFIALLLLGIDSGFSMTEAVLASMVDKTGAKRIVVLTVLSLVGFGAGVLFTTGGGLSWLGAIDSFVTEGMLGIATVGLLECLVLGWAWDTGKLRRHANSKSDWAIGKWWEYSVKFVIPLVLTGLVVWSLVGDIRGPRLELSGGDVADPGALAGRIEQGEDPASQGLRERLGPEARTAAAALARGESGDVEALVEGLNAVLRGPSLYEPGRFAGVGLSRETRALAQREDADTLLVNRLVLQEAYPGLVKPTANVGGFLIDAQGELVGRNVFGLGLTAIVLLVAVILALWRPNRQARIVEYDT